MRRERYRIRFSNGTYLRKYSPRHFRGGKVSIEKTINIDLARVFKDYDTAERIKADLESIVFLQKCEIEVLNKK